MKIPRLLPKKIKKPQESNEDDDDLDVEKVDQTDGQENSETQTDPAQETGQKKADNQAILRLLGEGEKVGHSINKDQTGLTYFIQHFEISHTFILFLPFP